MWGIIHCQDKADNKEKAISLFCLLQDGGAEKHGEGIAASDRDIKPTIEALLNIATFKVAEAGNFTDLYDESDKEALYYSYENIIESEDIADESFVESVFDIQSRISYALFLE